MSSLENILYYRSSGRESSTSIFPGMIDHTTLSQQIPKEILVRRNSVSAESVIPGQGANNGLSTTVYRKTEEQKRRLLSVLKSVFLFSGLDQEQYSQVMNAFMEKVIVNEGTEVITQGDVGDYFYIVEKGNFDFYVRHAPPAQSDYSKGHNDGSATAGDYFGELALMYNAPRAATVVSAEPECILWALDGASFRQIIADSNFARRRLHETFLESVPLLSSLTASQRTRIAEALKARTYSAGATIVRQGDAGTSFFLLVSGEARAYKASFPGCVMTYHRGSFFGERAFRKNTPRAATIITVTDVIVATLDREAFFRLLGPVEDIMGKTAYAGIVNDEEEARPGEAGPG